MCQTPSFTEDGFKDMDVGAWYGFLAPVGTPRDVVAKLNSAVNTILADRDFVEINFTSQGMVLMTSTPEQIGVLINSETERMAEIVKKSGATVE